MASIDEGQHLGPVTPSVLKRIEFWESWPSIPRLILSCGSSLIVKRRGKLEDKC